MVRNKSVVRRKFHLIHKTPGTSAWIFSTVSSFPSAHSAMTFSVKSFPRTESSLKLHPLWFCYLSSPFFFLKYYLFWKSICLPAKKLKFKKDTYFLSPLTSPATADFSSLKIKTMAAIWLFSIELMVGVFHW